MFKLTPLILSLVFSVGVEARQRRQDNRVADVTYSSDHHRMLSITNIIDAKSDDYRLCTKANHTGAICAVVYLEKDPSVISGFAITLQSGRRVTIDFDQFNLSNVDQSWLYTLIRKGKRVSVSVYLCGSSARAAASAIRAL